MQPTEVGIGQTTATSCFLRPMLLLPKFGQTPTKIIAHVAINETPQNKRVLARELCRVLRRNQEQIDFVKVVGSTNLAANLRV